MFYGLQGKEEIKDLLRWFKFTGDEEIAESLLELNKPLHPTDLDAG